jgi:putative SOS response-associated peptidase YedK
MCGRYRIKDTDELTAELRRIFKIPDWVMGPRYNIAPSQELPVVVTDDAGKARVATMRWGLVPFWDKSEKPKIAPINARSEDAFAKPMFRQSIQKRRALVPADGFFEFMWTALINLRLCASGLVPLPSALVSSSS